MIAHLDAVDLLRDAPAIVKAIDVVGERIVRAYGQNNVLLGRFDSATCDVRAEIRALGVEP